MKKWIIFILLWLPWTVQANVWHVMTDVMRQQLIVLQQQANLQRDIRTLNQMTLTQLQNQLAAMTGHRGYGNYLFNPKLQSWGEQTQTWEKVLQSYQRGGNPQELASIAQLFAKQFPIESNIINQAHPPHATAASYYTVQAETALAARAASQVAFDKIQQAIDYQQQLQAQIDNTATLKEALDLQNRLHVENNLVQLEIVRLLAVSNQQQAIQMQGQVNALTSSAIFLSH